MSYKKFYPNGWQSGESGGTPITPEALDHMEEGIKNSAPAGYGLGASSKWLEGNVDIDTVVDGGWYSYGEDNISAHKPFTVADVFVLARGTSTTCTQVAISRSDTIPLIKIRKMTAGIWGEWEWENPPMKPGVEYRTTKRHNGNAVYTRVVDFGALPNSTTKNIGYCSNGATACLSVKLLLSDGCVFTSGYNKDLSFSFTLGAYVDNTKYNVRVYTDGDFSSLTAVAVVEYTKD